MTAPINHLASSLLRRWRSHPFRGTRESEAPPPQRVIVVEHAPSASADYLVMPTVKAMNLPVERVSLDADPDVLLSQPGALVVLVRYINSRWRRALAAHRTNLAGLVYFMDDDLWDAAALAQLPGHYKRRIKRDALSQRHWLTAYCTEIWVGTELLAQKYAAYKPKLIALRPFRQQLTQVVDPVWVCYHGTGSHAAERDWVIEVAEQALVACPNLHFEIYGDTRINRRCKHLPRTHVLHAQSWPNYLSYTGSIRRDIGLAPLLEGRFNAGRGIVKFYDFVRMGAVGLYSRTPPYESWIRNGEDGLLLPNDSKLWVESIIALANDPSRRQMLAGSARTRALTVMSDLS